MRASRISFNTGAASGSHSPPTHQTPALTCDLCQWPMGLHEVARLPDGSIPGLLTCSLCVEDNLATRQLEAQP